MLLKQFESHGAVAAAASASKGIAEVSCVLFLGLFGVLVHPDVSPAVFAGAFEFYMEFENTHFFVYLRFSVMYWTLPGAAACPFVSSVEWQPHSAAACACAFVGLLALVGVLSCALKSCFSVVEGLDRHVLAGGLFSGGEQASGRVDIPGKDIQQQAAAANETSIFFLVKSLGGASYVVKMEHQATVARVKQHVALRSGVREDVFYLVREGRVLTQLHMCSYLCGGTGAGRQPEIPGQWVCPSCGMGGCWPTRQSCYRCGAPRLGGNGGQRPQRESHYPGQPCNQGLSINPAKIVLRSFKGA